LDQSQYRHSNNLLYIYQYIDYTKYMNRIAVVTGASRNLGFALAQGLAMRLNPGDIIYLTGPNNARVEAALGKISAARAEVRAETLDVSDGEAVQRFAAQLENRHGGVDIVFSNHYTRVQPDEDTALVIDQYVAVNNLGTTHILRSFAPLLRDGSRLVVVASRAGSLRALAPALHSRFDGLASLEEVDRAVCAWRDSVRERRSACEAWPAWINIPSKIGQVAAVRALAHQRRNDDLRRGILIAAVCPGLIDTGASRRWFPDMSRAQTCEEAAGPLMDLVLNPSPDPVFYGELVQFGKVLPWKE
jgi:NAD(P)-dependent dehydrogenase (short-subunit alcohol dehydrogenase family)